MVSVKIHEIVICTNFTGIHLFGASVVTGYTEEIFH